MVEKMAMIETLTAYKCKFSYLKRNNPLIEEQREAIQSEGLKLKMDLIVPMIDGIKDATATKITLQFTKQDKSSDVADNINGSRKKHIIRDLGLNLEASENKEVLGIFKKMQAGKIDQAEAFAQIKAEFKGSDDYNDAEVKLRVGSRHRTVQWNEFESIMGTYDISNALHEAFKISHDFVGELIKLANEYYKDIIESEEV